MGTAEDLRNDPEFQRIVRICRQPFIDMAAAINEIPGLDAHHGAGDSPGMYATYVNRDADPDEPYYGVKRLYIQFQEVDQIGFSVTDMNHPPGGAWLLQGYFALDGIEVTSELYDEHEAVREMTLEITRNIVRVFAEWDFSRRQEIIALPGVVSWDEVITL